MAGGQGNDFLHAYNGVNNLLNGGDGNDTLISSAESGTGTLIGGAGNDALQVVYSYGLLNIDVGEGDDTVSYFNGGYAGDLIDLGIGNDVIDGLSVASASVITTGAGQDRIVLTGFNLNSANQAQFTDFAAGPSGDSLDITALLNAIGGTGWDGNSNPFGSGFLRLLQSGFDTLLQLDSNGGGDSYITLVTFKNTTATAFTLDNFLPAIPPDGSAIPGQSLVGTNGNDTLIGGIGPDTLSGLDGDDSLSGGFGGDLLYGGLGNDAIDGGADTDTLILVGSRADYSFSGASATGITVTGAGSGTTDGTDLVYNVETVNFADGTYTMDALGNNAAPDDIAFAGSVAEDVAPGTPVGSATATDPNSGGGDTVSFSLTDDAGGLFAIDSTSGVVTLLGGLDAEAALSHNITIRATDSGGFFRDETFTVAVTDVNEFAVAAVSDSDGTTDAVAENAAIGTVVGLTAFAADADATANAITYSLYDNAGGRFSINAATGAVQVAGALDAEAALSHNISVRATSADGSFSTQSFSIAVTDVNDVAVSAPVDTDAAANAVAENAFAGTHVGITAAAIDSDVTPSVIIYSLFNNAGGRFQIDATAGVVSTALSLDFEASASHLITVRATSSDGSFADTIFTVSVLNGPDTITQTLTPLSDTYFATSNANYVLDGRAGADQITTAGGSDVIFGNAGNDVIQSGAGDDLITYRGSTGDFDMVDGGAGTNDRINALAVNTVIGLADLSNVETISANGFARVRIAGSTLADSLDFSTVTLTAISRIDMGSGNDTVTGSTAADTIVGGNGTDLLTGGAGADLFDYNAIGESRGATVDILADFTQTSDRIDLSTIDANAPLTGNQAFAFIGTAAFTGVAGQLRYDNSTFDGQTRVFGDTDANGIADFELTLTGTLGLIAADFVL